MNRYLIVTAALVVGTYALASWIGGQLTDAGIAGAFCAALVLISEGIAYCERRNDERARRTRAQVWERRDSEGNVRAILTCDHPLTPQLIEAMRLEAERTFTFGLLDEHCISLIDTQAAVWDFRNGAPE